MLGWFKRRMAERDRARIEAVVEVLSKRQRTPAFDNRPDLKTNSKAYYHPVTGTWAIGEVKFLAPEQDRAVQALEVALPVIKSALDDKVPEDVVNDLTYDLIKILIDKGVM